ncbi:hypothetical protein LO772_29050 [Yinghuangia sp. ASG 101]|uniref:hypothetical protein n=1 Tax=Yinghuangia sp. ASG 101 TaxID=2896848 RepID=UPI001E37A8A4|nr:hypothetical protein [Yinghuangia sp. ASG 101]UGQ10824.1 hypothetical protein LO772_29050 [Yinghuangia sp. ASG 101]
MTATACHLQFVREFTEKALCEAGIDDETTTNVQLVRSELIGDSIRACGEFVPLVIVINAGLSSVTVIVHDPEDDGLPLRPEAALDDPTPSRGVA